MERLKVNKKEDASVRRKGIKRKLTCGKTLTKTLEMLDFQLGKIPCPNQIRIRYDELELRKQQKQA